MKRLGSERKVINLCDYLLYGWEENLSQTSILNLAYEFIYGGDHPTAPEY
jgi:hypothetical protein